MNSTQNANADHTGDASNPNPQGPATKTKYVHIDIVHACRHVTDHARQAHDARIEGSGDDTASVGRGDIRLIGIILFDQECICV